MSMRTSAVDFDRPFQLWAYSVSHGQLLFRSPASDARPTRVDVLFKNVKAMMVRDSYDHLTVRPASSTEEATIVGASGVATGPHAHYYVIEGAPLSFVVAGGIAAEEDEGSYADPSQLFVKSGL